VIVYGRHPVREALRGSRAVRRVWATPGAAREPWMRAVSPGLVTLVGEAEVAERAHSEGHQGICADVTEFRYAEAATLLVGERPLIVALDQVQDPQNLGSICRTAECAGASGIVIPERRSAEVTPAVCKASAGAVEHLAVARVRNLTDFLLQAKEAGAWCFGADARGGARLDELDLGDKLVLVLGSEGRGLRPRVASACDALIALPLHGRVESLSVGAAAAVLLYAAARPRP
jgi:23S rRNA (guanosine2251-2'-O)-methyltransferase